MEKPHLHKNNQNSSIFFWLYMGMVRTIPSSPLSPIYFILLHAIHRFYFWMKWEKGKTRLTLNISVSYFQRIINFNNSLKIIWVFLAANKIKHFLDEMIRFCQSNKINVTSN